MRPIELTLSAFGPFADVETVNFDSMGTSGIYLITGVTGAGKTTIFDGISYALFGQPSGDNRKESMLRSKYAQDTAVTFVKLVFEYRNKLYAIERRPTQQKPKERGSGFTERPAYAQLTTPDGKIITGDKAVSEKVTDILGIDKDQFSKIAMIAQGDFRKLLQASTEDRVSILRNVFKTEKFRMLQSRLDDEFNEIEKQIKDKRSDFYKSVSEIENDEESISGDFNAAKDWALGIKDTLAVLEKIMKADADKKQKIDKELNDIQLQARMSDKKIEQAQNYSSTFAEYENKNKELQGIAVTLEKIESDYAAADKKQSEIAKIDAEITLMTEGLADYDKLESVKSDCDKLYDGFCRAKSAYDSWKEKTEKLLAELNAMRDEQTKLSRIQTEMSQAQLLYSEKANRKNSVVALIDEISKLKSITKQRKQSQQEYQLAQEDSQRASNEYTRINKLYLDNQAGVLALGLAEGLPCPVCGSLAHPQKACIPDEAPDFKQVERAKKESEELQKKANAASETAQRLCGEENSKSNTVKSGMQALFVGKTYKTFGEIEKACGDEKQSLEREISRLFAELESYRNKIERKERLDKDEPLLSEKHKTACEEYLKCAESLNAANGLYNEAKRRLEELSSGFKYESKAQAQAAIDELKHKSDCLKNKIKALRDEKETVLKEQSAISGALQSIGNRLAQMPKIDEAEAAWEANAVKEQLKKTQQAVESIGNKKTANEIVIKRLKRLAEEITALETRFSVIAPIAKTMNGKCAEKIKLETFVQMNYFDKIISSANIRLIQMTGRQYELRRKKAGSRGSSGLELEVIDHNNGSVRDVASLSGGEAFKASLALALGLADEIQSSSGGIKLDTMFIDEGFGSLDDSSLDLAVDTLIELGQSNRLVGIISHVEKLKSRIDKQIVIRKDNSGKSRISIENN